MDANQRGKEIVDEATSGEPEFWETFYDRLDNGDSFTPEEAVWILFEFGRLYDIEEEHVHGNRATARTLGRKGGLKGGLVRASRMTAEERSTAARKAAQARWSKPR